MKQEQKETPKAQKAPTPDPALVRQNQLQQAIQATNKQILDMQGQQKLVTDMLRGLEIQAAEQRGALREAMRPAETTGE